MNFKLFQTVPLSDSGLKVWTGQLPAQFNFERSRFQHLWDLHPENYHIVNIMGRDIPTPRWQQAYGRNYRYTGAEQNALPIPDELRPFMDWAQENINPGLNGLLLNWYDGQRKHYIGAHRDDTRDLVSGSPIVTISLGEERIFRMRPYKQKGKVDIPMPHGSVIVVPATTNSKWTHEVPHFAKNTGRRISITLRVYH